MPGGIASFLYHLCLGLTEQGNEVVVLARDQGEGYSNDVDPPYLVQRYTLPNRFSALALAQRVFHHCRTEPPDVIFLGHVFPTPGLGVVLVSKLLRIPYVVLCHGADLGWANVSRANAWAVHTLLTSATLILANSEYTQQIVQQQAHLSENAAVLNPGVDAKFFHPGYETAFVKSKHNLENQSVILSVGRLVPRKNHQRVLQALPQVIQQVQNVRYLIVGQGPEADSLHETVDALGLHPYVIFVEPVATADLPHYYCASDLLVMPSKADQAQYEGFGIVFSEAGACGKPVIGGRSGGMNEAVIDGVTGLLVDPLDVDEIAGAIIRLLTDQSYAQKLGRNGRKRAVQELDWKRVVDRLETRLTAAIGHDELAHA